MYLWFGWRLECRGFRDFFAMEVGFCRLGVELVGFDQGRFDGGKEMVGDFGLETDCFLAWV